jgi:hypothetical protein
MTTNRIPIARSPVAQISPRAVELFVAMGRLRCSCLPPPRPPTQGPCAGCQQWYDLHAELHDELQLPPWQWPCVARRSPKRAGSTCWNDDIAARMQLLQEAARRNSSGGVRARPPEAAAREEEEGTDAELADHAAYLILNTVYQKPSAFGRLQSSDGSLALRLSDTQLDEVMRLCQPLVPHCRDVLLRILSHHLRGRRDVGDGELHRLARTIIADNRLFDPPLETEPHHGGKYGR